MTCKNERTTFVIGHKNPDADSICAAIALANFHLSRGEKNFVAARAGNLNAQSEYILSRFGVDAPEYLADLNPRVEFFMRASVTVATGEISLWQAINEMVKKGLTVLPITDAGGRYSAILHYNSFVQNVLRFLDPKRPTAVSTSIDLICETLNAQPLLLFNEKKIAKSAILMASSSIESFKKMLNMYQAEGSIVVTGDRREVLEFCIERGIRAVVVTNGTSIDKDLKEKATAKKVSILISPYDSSSTGMIMIYSMPVSLVADAATAPVHANDTIRSIRPLLAQSTSRTLPVIDDKNNVVGVISENDLLKEPNVCVALVDHNEFSQAIEGVENYRAIEVVDHHRLGNFTTREPIMFINRPVGATCTIIANMFRENQIPISKKIASIMLSAILSDTLVLKSATTTEADREAAEYLSNLSDLDIGVFGAEIIAAASKISGRSAVDVIHQDLKEYSEGKRTFSVSQIEVGSTDEILSRKSEFVETLESECLAKKQLFAALMVTDTTRLTSLLFIAGDANFLQTLTFHKNESGVYLLKDIVSRKKQLIPLLTEQLAKFG